MERDIFTKLEEKVLGQTWATGRMSFRDRLNYFINTGQWPGLHSEDADKMFLRTDIESTTDPVCRRIKEEMARKADF